MFTKMFQREVKIQSKQRIWNGTRNNNTSLHMLSDHMQPWSLFLKRKENPFTTFFGRPVSILWRILSKKISTCKRKRKRSDSVLWQKLLYPQKIPKSNVTTQKTPPKKSTSQRLWTNLGPSVRVTTATPLVVRNNESLFPIRFCKYPLSGSGVIDSVQAADVIL